jgi:hypothetical protein
MHDMNVLQNLRFAHLLFRSETIPDRQSDQFNVYLLDLAQLSYQRAMEGVSLDWAKRENRRARKLVYSDSWDVKPKSSDVGAREAAPALSLFDTLSVENGEGS